MVDYKVAVATGDQISAGTVNNIYIVLVGVRGQTSKHKLDHWGPDFIPGSLSCYRWCRKCPCCKRRAAGTGVDEYCVRNNQDISDILSVRLYKEYHLASDDWFCKYVAVASPGGDTYRFPCYQWLSGTTTLEIPDGKGKILVGNVNPAVAQQRQNELERKRNTHRWRYYLDGAPHCLDVERLQDLPVNDKYSSTKTTDLLTTIVPTVVEVKLKGYSDSTASWTNLSDMKRVLCFNTTKNSELVSRRWKEDAFFGYQFLNGVNPIQIKKCSQIPENFPVDDAMVASSLGTCTSLQKELQDGNLFLADYRVLHGIPTAAINDQQQYLAAPLCLLWKNLQDEIIPIAIQLGQTPGEDTPIFLPSDSECDWTLAKMWVRNAEFQIHEAVSHFLFTHLLPEVFSMATLRHLPMGHPVHKLLVPHFRYTFAINTFSRETIFHTDGTFDQVSSIGMMGLEALYIKTMEEMSFTSLCLPEDIASRAVETIPNYYYREDGMKIWLAIERFVSDIVHYYYEDDHAVSEDPELQAWVEEIFREGFLENERSGIPSSLKTKADLIKYLTMMIFRCSAEHAAVHNGQYDFYSWMPNAPSSMRMPPPSRKGTATWENILETLPQVNTTTKVMIVMWTLYNEPEDRRRLGHYPDQHFTEDMPKKFIQDFQTELAEISRQIKERNVGKELPYLYLDPENIENSVAI